MSPVIGIAFALAFFVGDTETRRSTPSISVRRGTIESNDHLAQMVKVRFENPADVRYFSIHQHVKIFLDGKPSGMVFLKDKMAVDVHLLDDDGIVIRLVAYHQMKPPPLARVTRGPFEDTDKIVKFYPHPSSTMNFEVGENLRMAVPKLHLVPLARSEVELAGIWNKFEQSIADPKFNIAEPWPIAIVPLGTKGKVTRVTEAAYEVEVAGGRYDHWTLFIKKEWAYPADEAQAAKKAEEIAAARPKSEPVKPPVTEPKRARVDDERRANEAEEKVAEEKLGQAKTLLRNNQREQAIEKLERLTIEHPDTKAAAEAKKLLKDLKK